MQTYYNDNGVATPINNSVITDKSLDKTSENAVANKPVAEAIESVNNRLANNSDLQTKSKNMTGAINELNIALTKSEQDISSINQTLTNIETETVRMTVDDMTISFKLRKIGRIVICNVNEILNHGFSGDFYSAEISSKFIPMYTATTLLVCGTNTPIQVLMDVNTGKLNMYGTIESSSRISLRGSLIWIV